VDITYCPIEELVPAHCIESDITANNIRQAFEYMTLVREFLKAF